jgi:asparagine synthase (glutamine-hydrolysing)
MSYTSLPQLLKYEDRNSMRFSIESRTPFADDNNLIEYIFSIPGVYKIHNGWSKYLLRESMNTIIPTQIIKRTDKIGFATPEYEWLQSIKSYIFDNINPDINAIMKIQQLEKDWETVFAGQNKNGVTNIWRYINFILWFKTFKVVV